MDQEIYTVDHLYHNHHYIIYNDRTGLQRVLSFIQKHIARKAESLKYIPMKDLIE